MKNILEMKYIYEIKNLIRYREIVRENWSNYLKYY